MEENNNKKMLYKDIKLQTWILIISICLVILVVIGSSYAAFVWNDTGSNQTVSSGNYTIEIENTSGTTITLANAYPMSDTEGKATTPYKFTIRNSSNIDVEFSLKLINDASKTNTLNTQNIKINLTGDNTIDTAILGQLTNSELDSGILKANSSKSYELRLWIKEDATNDTIGKQYNGKLTLDTKQVEQTGIEKEYKDKSGANQPLLAEGMIPVVYDEASENWEVADTSKEWYNYDEQMWANAVTTSTSTYRTAEVGTEIPMSAINSMWVWIPRYKYRIPSSIGVGTSTPPQIDVVFESGTNTTGSTLSSCSITSTSCYYTHPAFRNGTVNKKSTNYDQGGWDEELEGIWVGKFETSGSATTPTIKPDVISLRSQTVYNQFVTSLKFAGGTLSGSTVSFAGNSTYGLTSSTDTHMMKNTEWGAVAYLSQSKYGKMGNSNYSGANKEIYINNSGSNTYTGRSGGSPSASGTTYGSYSYNDKACTSSTCTGSVTTNAGQGASTTGTIYGIYDMSGGANEYVMGNWAGTVGYSDFTTSNFPGGSNGSKYYEKYTGTSSSSITSVKSIKGDATYETMRWYSDNAYFPYASIPWSSRGGDFRSTSNAGAFNSFNYNGSSSSISGFRVALIP